MDSLYLLIPIAIVFVAVGIKLLLWAIDNGQYDDLDKEAWSILNEDKRAEKKQPSQSQVNDDSH
ncbi:cbb3-type cytochrome oxidase assembly protein CcoS [Halioglobus maricola]|uniref:Cbb3-type cytochrome oxidase assembly protein CcoS n=1 Tax=Halioglobus maricola TaxID=2601894 RepID=A0A5P9NM17_9GAMM|nr:cbb3-type cytochrome oxidase assembly protein CcoS [Halioglobus maricola]QFU76545.1 cbb3-type cytochrome oxidase assembly protein CcoS [Halioglobus maricola]